MAQVLAPTASSVSVMGSPQKHTLMGSTATTTSSSSSTGPLPSPSFSSPSSSSSTASSGFSNRHNHNHHHQNSSVSSCTSSASGSAPPLQHKPSPLRYTGPAQNLHANRQSMAASGRVAASAAPVIRPYAFQSTPNLITTHKPAGPSRARDDLAIPISTGSAALLPAAAAAAAAASSTGGAQTKRPQSGLMIGSAADPLLPSADPAIFPPQNTTSTLPAGSAGSGTAAKTAQPSRYQRQSRFVSAGSDKATAGPAADALRSHSRSNSSTSLSNAAAGTAPPHSGSGPSAGLNDDQSTVANPGHVRSASGSDAANGSGTAKRYRRRSLGSASNLSVSSNHSSKPATAQEDRLSILIVGGSNSISGPDSPADTAKSPSDAIRPHSTLHERTASTDSATASLGTSPSRPAGDLQKAVVNPDSGIPAQAGPEGGLDRPAGNPPEGVSAKGTGPKQAPLFRSMKSRLRRALSFGSAAELQQMTDDDAGSEPRRASIAPRKSIYSEDRRLDLGDDSVLDDDLAARQEAAGLGEGIYSSQSGFSFSTDNVSISSTASSASVMLRKMGQGMKRSTRSLRSLFRPKSLMRPSTATSIIAPEPSRTAIGATPMSGAPSVEVSTTAAHAFRPTYSRSTQSKQDGDTGRESSAMSALSRGLGAAAPSQARSVEAIVRTVGAADAGHSYGSSSSESSVRSNKKGILKHTMSAPSIATGYSQYQSGSVTMGPAAGRVGMNNVRPKVGLRRPSEFALGGGYQHSNHSVPTQMRNISFNTNVQFYDVWSSMDYDRRGEIATCNRLTPDLAQQIKEELNTFKMEMEVHEMSKPNTQFF